MMTISFIFSYFLSKQLSMMTAYVCWSPEQVGEVRRVGAGEGVRVSVPGAAGDVPSVHSRGAWREAVLLDLACPSAHQVLQQASISRGFDPRYSWLLLDNSSYDRELIELALEPYEILPDADVVWAAPDQLVDVYRVKLDHPLLLTPLGLDMNCSREELAALWGALPPAQTRRKDMKNVTLRGATVISQPDRFKSWSDTRHREFDTHNKLTYPLMLLSAQDMNFRWNLRQTDAYGVQTNGSWSGLAGLLQRRRVDVGLASIFMRADRMLVLHYFAETVSLSSAFIFRQPPRSAVSNVFLAPFSRGVWAATGGVALLVTVLLALMVKQRQASDPHPDLEQIRFLDTFTFSLGTLCQQGYHVWPGVTSVRVVMFSALVSALFVFTAYSAKIVALLQAPSDQLRDIDDLTRSHIALGVQESTYMNLYFKESVEPATQRLYRRKIQPLGDAAVYTPVSGIHRLRTDFFAFQVERNSAYDIISQTFTEREKCSLKEIEAFRLPQVSIPMAKHSGYKELFGTRMRWMREVGLMSRTRRVWVGDRPRCEGDGQGFATVALHDVLPALQVLWLGAGCAVLALLGELCAQVVLMRRARNAETAPVSELRIGTSKLNST